MGQPPAHSTHMSNNPRIYIWGALALVVFLNYQAWMTDYGPKPGANTTFSGQTSTAPGNTVAPPKDLSNNIPQASRAEQPGTGENRQPRETGATPAAAPATSTDTPAATTSPAAQVIHVHTDVLDLDISTTGGTIQKADLQQYAQVKGQAALVRLENVDDPLTTYVLQSGLVGPEKTPYPTHLAQWSAARASYDIDGQQELRVPLTWTSDQGVTVTKTYVFHRGLYNIDLQYSVQNHGCC